jgi:PTS system beta-glucosides-specific IIC component
MSSKIIKVETGDALAAVFGSTLLNIFPDDSDFVFVCNQVYNAAFYFMPIVAGFSAAQKLKANPFLGAMMGAILMEPSFAALTEAGKTSVNVFGVIPAPVAGYAQTLIPVLLCVAALSPIQRFFEKVLPEAIETTQADTLMMCYGEAAMVSVKKLAQRVLELERMIKEK